MIDSALDKAHSIVPFLMEGLYHKAMHDLHTTIK
jgi:hypothetical protein